jgi:hypothetical protein
MGRERGNGWWGGGGKRGIWEECMIGGRANEEYKVRKRELLPIDKLGQVVRVCIRLVQESGYGGVSS